MAENQQFIEPTHRLVYKGSSETYEGGGLHMNVYLPPSARGSLPVFLYVFLRLGGIR